MSSPLAVPSPLSRLLVGLLALLLLPLTALLSAAPAHATPGIAEGAVYDALGDPLEAVDVEALAAPAYTTVAASVTTDATGAYALPLAAGTYHLRFQKTGYQPTYYGGSSLSEVVVDGDGDITVDGEPVVDNLLDDVTMTTTAEHPVSGSVRNAADVSLAGITVKIFLAGDDETPLDTATTTGSGGYELQVPTGVYHVRYTDEGGTYLPTWYGGAEPEDVTVTGPLALDPVTLATPPPASEYPIAGTVTDANGDPVAGVTVTVTGVGGSSDTGTGVTDADGGYAVSVLPGTYQVGFAKLGYVDTKYGGDTTPATVTVATNGALSVSGGDELIGNRLDDVTLAGTPFNFTGAVETTGGVGIVGITVRAFPEGSTDPQEVVDSATSVTAGSYTLDLPIGSYDLEFADNDGSSPTYVTTSLAQVRVTQDGALHVAGSDVAGLPDVAMAVSSADTPHPVTGWLVDVNGAEVDDLTVSAVPQGATPGANATSDTTGADGGLGDHGRYRLMLKPGSYQLEVEGGADWADTTYVGEGIDTALVTVQLNGTVLVNGVEAVGAELGSTEVVGTTTYALSGSVKEGATGLSGITVEAYAEFDLETVVATTTSGAGGAWTLTGAEGLVVGTYVIELSGSSGGNTYDKTSFGGATPTPVTMAQGGVAFVDGSALVPANTLPAVLMTKSSADTAHPVTGEVTDVNGDPIASATVSVAGGPAAGPFSTDGDGAYTLMLKPGTYTVTFAKTGFTSATYPGPGEAAVSVTVQLDGSVLAGSTPVPGEALDGVSLEDAVGDVTVSGTVAAAAGGAAISGIHVEVFPEGDISAESRVAEATTSGTGTWSVTTLKIGTYQVRYTDDDGGAPAYVTTWYGGADSATAHPVKIDQQGNVYVNGSETPLAGHDLGITTMAVGGLDTPHDVLGEVVDVNGDGIDGMAVTATKSDNSTTSTTTGADGDLGDHGRFRLHLTPGSYQLTVAAANGFAAGAYFGDSETVATVTVGLNGEVTATDTDLFGGNDLGSINLVGTTTEPLSGTVLKEGGTGLGGITVVATPVSGAATRTATSDSSGAFTLNLPVDTYQIQYVDNLNDGTTYTSTYYGGSPPAEVKVANDGTFSVGDETVAGLEPVTLAVASASQPHPVKGTVYDPDYDPLNGVTVTATPVSPTVGSPVVGTTGADPDEGAPLGDAGVYRLMLLPGKYRLVFTKDGYQPTPLVSYDDPWVPVTLTVGLDGRISAPGLDLAGGVVDDVQLLLPAPTMVKAPVLTGRVAYGQVVTTSFGTWSPSFGKDNTYIEWFLDDRPADNFAVGSYGEKFKVPASAVGKKLTYRMSVDDPDGIRASGRFTSAAFAVRPAVSTVTAAFKRGKLTVTVRIAGVPRPVGALTVLEGRKKLGSAKLTARNKGVRVFPLKLKKGKHRLTVVYVGPKGVKGSRKVITIRV